MKNLRIAGVLVALMVAAAMFMPAGAALSGKMSDETTVLDDGAALFEEINDETTAPDDGAAWSGEMNDESAASADGAARLIGPDVNLTKVSDDGKTTIYTVVFRISESDVRYFHVEKRRTVDANGRENGTILVQTQDACGCDIRGSFGNESSYVKSSRGIRVHLSPEDMSDIYYGEDGHRKFATWFALATGLEVSEASLFGDEMLPTTMLGYTLKTQKDWSLDFSMSSQSIAAIHAATTKKYCQYVGITFTGRFRTGFCMGSLG